MEQNGTATTNGSTENWKKFPFAMESFGADVDEEIRKQFQGIMMQGGSITIGPEKWVMPASFADYADELWNFEARADDVYICTMPRSGTTWTQEMIWLLCNDLNYEAAKATDLDFRFPFFEFHTMVPKAMLNDPEAAKKMPPSAKKLLEAATGQRFIKTHLPLQLMPPSVFEKGCKIVYVARNPKDVSVSFYHFMKSLTGMGFQGDYETFAELFMDDSLHWGPYFEHVKEGWSHRNDANVHFIFYEDLVMNLRGSLIKLADFLERPLDNDDLPALMDHLSVKNFKNNTSVNKESLVKYNVMTKKDFIRRGEIGGNPEMTLQIAEKFDKWSEQKLARSDLKFPYALRHKMEMYKMKANQPFKK